jgi:hypothetical protein
MHISGTYRVAVLTALISLSPGTAQADYATARRAFNSLPIEQQTSIGLALVATGDFEGLIEFGFNRRLYRALTAFERAHGFAADGTLTGRERQALSDESRRFFSAIGTGYDEHPFSGARLLVPRKLFNARKTVDDGYIYERQDGSMSLSFVAFATRDKSYDALYSAMSQGGGDRAVIYTRKFDRYFVVTGMFNGRKFYSWMSRGKTFTSGFTYSWNDASDAMGRKVSTLLANSFVAGDR